MALDLCAPPRARSEDLLGCSENHFPGARAGSDRDAALSARLISLFSYIEGETGVAIYDGARGGEIGIKFG